MVDDAYRRRWARFPGWASLALGLVVSISACSGDDPTPNPDDDNGGSGGTAASGGTGLTSGASGTGAGGAGQGGVGGSVSGAAGTGSGTAGAAGISGGTGAVGGSAGASGGTSGAGGAPAMLVMPIARPAGCVAPNCRYVFEFMPGGLYFEVNPEAGARIVSVRLDATELLTGPSVEAINYGSTFWTSPQSGWVPMWPPPAEIDRNPYNTSVAGQSIVALGTASASLGASVGKRFTPDLAKQSVLIEYQLTATAAKMFAPWEITRVFPNGWTFYGNGATAPAGCGGFPLPAVQMAAGATWVQVPATLSGNQKLCADGVGWIAHLVGDILIAKKFADVPAGQAAPGEGEIEIFLDGMRRYVEVENQGAYEAYTAGQQRVWPVTWYVRRVPAGLMPGTAELVQYVQSLWQ